MNIEKYINGARRSKFGLFKLNLGLGFIIPFNRPHKIKIKEIGEDFIKTTIPYRRKNMNHIRGIHACGLATAAEFASGFHLLTKLDSKKYRLIMESLEMKYHYQAKSDVTALFEADNNWIKTHVLDPLSGVEKVFVRCEIKLTDAQQNHVATGYTNWQIKDWSAVKTKI
jgi:acyl-coenzyme A thioesterase PaaI-like protein